MNNQVKWVANFIYFIVWTASSASRLNIIFIRHFKLNTRCILIFWPPQPPQIYILSTIQKRNSMDYYISPAFSGLSVFDTFFLIKEKNDKPININYNIIKKQNQNSKFKRWKRTICSWWNFRFSRCYLFISGKSRLCKLLCRKN